LASRTWRLKAAGETPALHYWPHTLAEPSRGVRSGIKMRPVCAIDVCAACERGPDVLQKTFRLGEGGAGMCWNPLAAVCRIIPRLTGVLFPGGPPADEGGA